MSFLCFTNTNHQISYHLLRKESLSNNFTNEMPKLAFSLINFNCNKSHFQTWYFHFFKYVLSQTRNFRAAFKKLFATVESSIQESKQKVPAEIENYISQTPTGAIQFIPVFFVFSSVLISFETWCLWSVVQQCLTLCDSMECSPPGSSVHGIFQARIPEWVAISYFRGSSRPGD